MSAWMRTFVSVWIFLAVLIAGVVAMGLILSAIAASLGIVGFAVALAVMFCTLVATIITFVDHAS